MLRRLIRPHLNEVFGLILTGNCHFFGTGAKNVYLTPVEGAQGLELGFNYWVSEQTRVRPPSPAFHPCPTIKAILRMRLLLGPPRPSVSRSSSCAIELGHGRGCAGAGAAVAGRQASARLPPQKR